MEKRMVCFWLFMLVLILGGCGQHGKLATDTLKATTVLIRSDGSMEQYLMETFDKSYYNVKDLKAFAKKTVKEYNNTSDGDPVSLEWVRAEDKQVMMLLSYDSVEAFAQFHMQDASFMTVAEAKEQKLLPEMMYPAGKESEVSVQDITLDDSWSVFFLAADSNIQIDGEMKYYQNAVYLNPVSVQAKENKTAIIIFS